MLLLFIVAGLAPVGVVLGLVLWRRYIAREQTAGGLIGGVAIGLAAGVVLGTGVGMTVLLIVLTTTHALGRAR